MAVTPDAPPHNQHYGDAFVVFSVTVLSCAVGAWFLVRLGLPLWVGSLAALVIYALLLGFHLLVRRSLLAAAVAAPAAVGKASRQAPPLRPAPDLPAPKLDGQTAGLPEPPPAAVKDPAYHAPPLGPAETLPEPLPGDPFNFRPSREPSLSPLSQAPLTREPMPAPASASAPGKPHVAEPAGPADASQPEMSVEMIQDLIKKLADELNTTAPAPERAPPPLPRAPDADELVDRSIEALQAAARSMQVRTIPAAEAPSVPPALPRGTRQPVWPTLQAGHLPPTRPAPEPASDRDTQLSRVAEALAAERMEVLLEPIHGLSEGRPRHFEVSMRLLAADGGAIDQREYARTARGSGLLARIDAAKIIRAARVAGRLAQRGREAAVLTSTAGESLTDQAFLDAAASGVGRGGNTGLVLAFTQSEVRAFTPGHAHALADLAAIGFRFALQDVTDLDMDFAALAQMGFAFVELDAPVFLEGLPAADGHVPAADLCRHLADFGLGLIVGRIEDEWLLARVLGLGVALGKGALFGGARLVKDEVVSAA